MIIQHIGRIGFDADARVVVEQIIGGREIGGNRAAAIFDADGAARYADGAFAVRFFLVGIIFARKQTPVVIDRRRINPAADPVSLTAIDGGRIDHRLHGITGMQIQFHHIVYIPVAVGAQDGGVIGITFHQA